LNKRFSEEQIIGFLKETGHSMPVKELRLALSRALAE
jgi:hypothetical protein